MVYSYFSDYNAMPTHYKQAVKNTFYRYLNVLFECFWTINDSVFHLSRKSNHYQSNLGRLDAGLKEFLLISEQTADDLLWNLRRAADKLFLLEPSLGVDLEKPIFSQIKDSLTENNLEEIFRICHGFERITKNKEGAKVKESKNRDGPTLDLMKEDVSTPIELRKNNSEALLENYSVRTLSLYGSGKNELSDGETSERYLNNLPEVSQMPTIRPEDKMRDSSSRLNQRDNSKPPLHPNTQIKSSTYKNESEDRLGVFGISKFSLKNSKYENEPHPKNGTGFMRQSGSETWLDQNNHLEIKKTDSPSRLSPLRRSEGKGPRSNQLVEVEPISLLVQDVKMSGKKLDMDGGSRAYNPNFEEQDRRVQEKQVDHWKGEESSIYNEKTTGNIQTTQESSLRNSGYQLNNDPKLSFRQFNYNNSPLRSSQNFDMGKPLYQNGSNYNQGVTPQILRQSSTDKPYYNQPQNRMEFTPPNIKNRDSASPIQAYNRESSPYARKYEQSVVFFYGRMVKDRSQCFFKICRIQGRTTIGRLYCLRR